MRVLELFSGTRSVGKVCEAVGWESISVDMILPATHEVDIMDFNYKQYPKDYFDIVWASPPCVEYSKLQDGWLNRMRKGKLYTREQQEIEMSEADKLVLKSLEIIKYFNPSYWFIENPNGRLKDRKIMGDIPYYTVDYCMYSDWGYRKRTCIWTNKKDFIPRTCNKQCGNMVGNLHKTNLGNTERKARSGGDALTKYQRYRVPENLLKSLFDLNNQKIDVKNTNK